MTDDIRDLLLVYNIVTGICIAGMLFTVFMWHVSEKETKRRRRHEQNQQELQR